MPEKQYIWDGRLQRYRDKSTGRMVRRETVVKLIEKNIELKQEKIVTSFDKMIRGEISFLDFQIEARETIKYVHAQSYLVGKGGFGNTESKEYLELARDLKTVHYPAFRDYLQQLKNGDLTEAQARQRLRGFMQAGRMNYNYGVKQGALSGGFLYARRFLSVAEHCPDCPIYAAMGVVTIDKLILPGEQCQCIFNCKCYVEYYKERP